MAGTHKSDRQTLSLGVQTGGRLEVDTYGVDVTTIRKLADMMNILDCAIGCLTARPREWISIPPNPTPDLVGGSKVGL